jgi:hypothetical protein
MEGVYTDPDELDQTLDTSMLSTPWDSEPLLVPWEDWADTEEKIIGSPVAYTNMDPNPAWVSLSQPLSPIHNETIVCIETSPSQLLPPISNEAPDATGHTAVDWGYTIPTEVVEEQPRLNSRGLPMRRSAMQVQERVKNIVKWENATDDSAAVRQIANAIDQEITRESSRKRSRVTTSETYPDAYDSELSDGADGESEGGQISEPDTDDSDSEFIADEIDEEVEDEMFDAEDAEDDEDEGDKEDEEDEESVDDDSEDIISSEDESDEEMSTPDTESGDEILHS